MNSSLISLKAKVDYSELLEMLAQLPANEINRLIKDLDKLRKRETPKSNIIIRPEILAAMEELENGGGTLVSIEELQTQMAD